jgi:hypothetical protein
MIQRLVWKLRSGQNKNTNENPMRLISISILSLLSAGCVFGPVNYKPPENGPTTIIKFVNKSNGKLRISIYEESHNCQRRRKIEDLEAGHETSHVIYADKRLTFQYYQTLPSERRYCLLNIRFNPKSDKEYIFYSNTNASSCFWSMTEHNNGENKVQVPLEKIPWHTAWSSDGSFCDG